MYIPLCWPVLEDLSSAAEQAVTLTCCERRGAQNRAVSSAPSPLWRTGLTHRTAKASQMQNVHGQLWRGLSQSGVCNG